MSKIKAFVFGAGDYGKKAVLQYSGSCDILSFLDNDKELQGKRVMGIDVLSPDVIKQQNFNAVIIAVKNKNGIKKQLLEFGVNAYNIVDYTPPRTNCFFIIPRYVS